MAVVGIRHEDKSEWEKRAPLVPEDVERLVREQGLTFHVQSSSRRCFPDEDYRRAGAKITPDLSEAEVILGVKEIPAELFERSKTYFFFSHTMKGQPYNMPMLRALLDQECSLLDYELVTNADGVRTVAFGRYAGLAGAFDTMWALGRRLAWEGHETPLAGLSQATEYEDVAAAREALRRAGEAIASKGLPPGVGPLVIGVTGEGGKVWGGALEILRALPAREVEAEDLAPAVAGASSNEILLVSYGPGDLVEPVDGSSAYSFEDYLEHPDRYRARFAPHLELLTAIVHGILWAPGYPRFILREDLARILERGSPRLRLIGDVTCDPDGSNESLVRVTDPGNPMYVFDPATGETVDGWEGPGLVVLPVDIFPAEIPVDSSRHFSEVLSPLLPDLARGNEWLRPDNESLPAELRSAFLASRGRLLPEWEKELAGPLAEHGSGSDA